MKRHSEPSGEVDWMLEKLNAMQRIPDGFVCANDFLAIRLMQALRRKGLCVPEDVMVTGFDGSPEAGVINNRFGWVSVLLEIGFVYGTTFLPK